MTPADLYLLATIHRHRAPTDDPHPQTLLRRLKPHIDRWPLSRYLESMTLSGSQAKQTALRSASDVDIFLSLAPNTPGPLSSLAPSLITHFREHLPSPRNVSVRITFEGAQIDLVPARRRPNSTHHTLWQQRYETWLQTDIAQQLRHVQSSGLTTEILALKLWTRRNTLRFPSFLQELTAIRALPPNRPISESLENLLTYLATNFPATRLYDPANTNNEVSSSLTPEEKSRIANAAEMSLKSDNWTKVL